MFLQSNVELLLMSFSALMVPDTKLYTLSTAFLNDHLI